MAQFEAKSGGFLGTLLGMVVHEMYHIKDGDTFEDKTDGIEVHADRKKVLEELETEEAQKLYITYKDIVFKLGDNLANKEKNKTLLEDLSVTIKTLKEKYSNAWEFIWEYEYTEGFAEYASAQSLVASLVLTLEEQIHYQKTSISNNFAYRTGAIAGLYMYYSLKDLPFSLGEHKSMGSWEIILSKENIQTPTTSIESIYEKYKPNLSEGNLAEIESVKEYLISTVQEL